MGALTQAESAQRRDAILSAAEELLREGSADAMTISAVAREAAVAKGSIYTYFASKNELLFALRERFLEGMLTSLESVIGRLGKEDFVSVASDVVESLIDYQFEHRALATALLEDRTRAGLGAVADEKLQQMLANGIRVGQAAGVFRPTDPWITAGLVLHGVAGVVRDALRQADDAERELLVDNTLSFVVAALRA
jgi:AcrR family transcriptional regulator